MRRYSVGDECRFFYHTKAGELRDCTGTVRSENSDRIFLRDYRLERHAAIDKELLLHIDILRRGNDLC